MRPRLIVEDLVVASTSRPMLRGGNFHLALVCVVAAQLRDAFLVIKDFVFVVGVVCLSAAGCP